MISFLQMSDEIRDAIIYLDSGCTESFEYLGAFSLFLELGAHAICSLEKISPLDKVSIVALILVGWDLLREFIFS